METFNASAARRGRGKVFDLGNLYRDGRKQKRVTRSAFGAAARCCALTRRSMCTRATACNHANQTPSSRAGGVISQLLSQDSRVVTVYSVHCVQCALSTSAAGGNPHALATIPTPLATHRPVRSVQDGCADPQSMSVLHNLRRSRSRVAEDVKDSSGWLHFLARSTPHTASSPHKNQVGVSVGAPGAPAIELILLRDALKTELRHRG